MKKILLSLALTMSLGTTTLMAQATMQAATQMQPATQTQPAAAPGEGIVFLEGKSYAEALAEAARQDKILFIDCYTSWCGPCKMMSSKIFPQKAVGDYFNAHFVSLKVDMEKGEGPSLKDQFQVKAYPTFLFLDKTGKEINRIVGGTSKADEFIQSVKDGIGEMSLSSMNKRYDEGQRDTTFLLNYLKVLNSAYDSKRGAEVADILLKGNGQELLNNPSLFAAFLRYNTSPLSEAFQYVLDHKSEFDAKYKMPYLNMVMERTWMQYPRNFVVKNADGTYTYDDAAMEAYKQEMSRRGVEKAGEISLNYDIHVAETKQDWKTYASLCSKSIKLYGEKDLEIYNWALAIQKNCTDKKVRQTAIKWMKTRMKNIEKAKEQPLKPGQMKAMSLFDVPGQYGKLIAELEK